MNALESLAQAFNQPLFISPFCRQLTQALFHFLWQGLAVALALALVVRLFGIRRARDRYSASLAAFVLMALCPVGTVIWLHISGVSSGASATFTAEANLAPATMRGHERNLAALPPGSLSAWIDAVQPYAFAAWLLGVTIFAGRLSAGAVGVARLRRKLMPLPLDLASSVDRLGKRLSIDALPLVFLSRNVAEAMALGLVRPLVLIPAAWATEMPLPLLEAVIAHELAHIRRCDLWINLFQRVVETLLFFHPAVWWLSRRLRMERELCADELAVWSTGRRLEYAEALEQVALRRQADIRPALAAFMRGEKNMRLLERVRNVLGVTAAERSRLWPVGLAMLALPLAVWALALSGGSATADEERRDGDQPRVEREADDDRSEAEEDKKFFGKEEREDGGDDEREGRREKEGRDDDDGEDRVGRREKDVKEDDDDADDKRERDAEREDGDRRKEGPRDGEVKKDRPRDGDKPRKEGVRDGDRPRKEGEREGDRPRKEGDREKVREVLDGGEVLLGGSKKERLRGEEDGDGDIAKLKVLIRNLMVENDRLRAELAEARDGKVFRKEGGDREKEYGIKKEAGLKDREAAERKDAEARKRKEADREEGDGAERKEAEARERKERAAAEAAEQKEAALRKEREAAERKEGEAREGKEERKEEEPKRGDGASGAGLRIMVPALGPTPLAFDFGFPVASVSGDGKQNFSFFIGATR